MRFYLGHIVVTPGALDTFGYEGCFRLLLRHAGGDWGDVDGRDRRENERALRDGARLFSAYDTPAGRCWIITEADRSSTCVLLPSEY